MGEILERRKLRESTDRGEVGRNEDPTDRCICSVFKQEHWRRKEIHREIEQAQLRDEVAGFEHGES